VVAWLLWAEGVELLQDAKEYNVYENGGGAFGIQLMAMLINAKLNDGEILITDLAYFTAFNNPKRDLKFNQLDWEMINLQPTDLFYRELNPFWIPNKGPYSHNGVEVTKWWETWENNSTSIYYTVVDPINIDALLYFGP
jgi:hypothetical protein